MPRIIHKDVRFPRRFSDLTSLSLTLKTPDGGTVLVARTVVVVAPDPADPGFYQAPVTFPERRAYKLVWDTGDPAVTASEVVDLSGAVPGSTGGGSGDGETLREGLYAFLAGAPALQALVADRVYPGLRPQGSARPAVTFEVTSDDPDEDLAGPLGTSTARVQVGCWGKRAADCVAVSRAIEGLFRALTAGGKDGDLGGVVVRRARKDQEQEQTAPAQDAAGGTDWHFPIDYLIQYWEP